MTVPTINRSGLLAIIAGALLILVIALSYYASNLNQEIVALRKKNAEINRLVQLTDFYNKQAKKVWGNKAGMCSSSIVSTIDSLIKPYGDTTTTEQILAIMTIESGFNVKITSPTGAHGLMQLIIGTARIHEKVDVKDLDDPVTNIRIGIKEYIRLIRIFNGDKLLALLGYNRGAQGASLFPKNVSYLNDDYVRKIIQSNYNVAQLLESL